MDLYVDLVATYVFCMCRHTDSQAGRQTDIMYPWHLGLMGRMILSDSGTTLMLRKDFGASCQGLEK